MNEFHHVVKTPIRSCPEIVWGLFHLVERECGALTHGKCSVPNSYWLYSLPEFTRTASGRQQTNFWARKVIEMPGTGTATQFGGLRTRAAPHDSSDRIKESVRLFALLSAGMCKSSSTGLFFPLEPVLVAINKIENSVPL